MHRRSQFKRRLGRGRGRQTSSGSRRRNHPSCAPTPTLLPQFQMSFTSFHFSGYQENRNVSFPTESPWNNLTRADPVLVISQTSISAKAVSMQSTGSTAAPQLGLALAPTHPRTSPLTGHLRLCEQLRLLLDSQACRRNLASACQFRHLSKFHIGHPFFSCC